MTWETTVFFEAFAAVGMVKPAHYWHQAMFSPLKLSVDLNKPSVDALEQVRDSDFMVEYEYSSGKGIRKGGFLYIDGQIFKVSEPPRRQDNGDFSIVDLTLMGTATEAFNPELVPWVMNAANLVSAITEGPA